MAELAAAGLAALVLGLSTTLAPCALAANLSALSFLLGWVGDRRTSLSAGLALAGGAMLSAATLAWLLTSLGLAVPAVVAVLREAAPMLVGPLLIVVGMVHAGLLGPLPFRIRGGLPRRWLDRPGAGLGAGLGLGLLLPLLLCPSTAAVFLAAVVPLAVGHGSRVALPFLYGLGVATPLVFITIAVRAGAGIVSPVAPSPNRHSIRSFHSTVSSSVHPIISPMRPLWPSPRPRQEPTTHSLSMGMLVSGKPT